MKNKTLLVLGGIVLVFGALFTIAQQGTVTEVTNETIPFVEIEDPIEIKKKDVVEEARAELERINAELAAEEERITNEINALTETYESDKAALQAELEKVQKVAGTY